MTYAQRLRLLCPKHKRKGRSKQRGFRCICEETGEAFALGYRSVRRRSRAA